MIVEAGPNACYTENIMYLTIDIGGTKTFVASLTNEGVITERLRFETPQKYDDFLTLLTTTVAQLTTKGFIACCVGAPGRVDRKRGIGLAMGNLPWKNVPFKNDIEPIIHCPVVVENDANLAGLSEAMLVKEKFDRVLYVTISTGIGTGFIVSQQIDPSLADSEGGKILLEHRDKLQEWEDFASGRAIVERYGKRAEEISSEAAWKEIAHNLAIGLIDLIAVMQPQLIIIGGGVGLHLDRFSEPLLKKLKKFETPLVPIPPISEAKRPEDAVLYGGYDLAKSMHGKTRS